jgi:hypothetical protein
MIFLLNDTRPEDKVVIYLSHRMTSEILEMGILEVPDIYYNERGILVFLRGRP